MPEQTVILDNPNKLSEMLNKKREIRTTIAIPKDLESEIGQFAVKNHFNFNQAVNVILAAWYASRYE